jgi:hypothetical protein
MNPASTAVALLACCAANAWGQSPPSAQVAASPASSTWTFSAAVYTYLVPDDGNYAQLTLTADRDRLHLEGRYNYENLETASVWVGYNFGGGATLTWELTPLLGGVFGQTAGLAPGYKGSLSWWKVEFYSEGEYVLDAGDVSDSFFYNWSELTFAPVEWFRGGLVTQRTRVDQTDRDIQRGLLVGATFQRLDLTTYVFNPDESTPTVVVAVTVSW